LVYWAVAVYSMNYPERKQYYAAMGNGGNYREIEEIAQGVFG
jgi:hypothetical protein